MENKLNLVEILKNCPSGMELDCTICNGVKFIELDRNPNFPIVVRANNGYEFSLTKYGQVHNIDDARCVIYPKGKTTWKGFVPPCKFNTGDIIFTLCASGNIWISIFKKKMPFGEVETYADYYYNTKNNNLDYCRINTYGQSLCTEKDIAAQRLATEEEREKLLKAIEGKGYRWNSENKTLERFIKPKFKVGDRIRKKGENSTFTITDVNEAHYFCGKYVICDTCDNNWELVPNKFDINSLIPFESRVLVRDCRDDIWRASFWGCLVSGEYDFIYDTTRGCYRQCIPYEGNEHLLGKTDNCSEFYKNW